MTVRATRPAGTVLVTLTLVGALAVAAVPTADAATGCVAKPRSVTSIDYDGDGRADTAYGSVLARAALERDGVGNFQSGGTVVKRGDCGTTTWFPSDVASDLHKNMTWMGQVVKAIDLDRDGFTDVLSSAPGARSGRGTVVVFYGAAAGAPRRAPLELAVPALRPGDHFGAAFDVARDNERTVVIVGAPGTDVGTGATAQKNVGRVYSFSFRTGLAVTSRPYAAVWRLGYGNFPGSEHTYDSFGEVIEANSDSSSPTANIQVFVGIPKYRDYNHTKPRPKKPSGGAVLAFNLRTGRTQLITQATKGVPGNAEYKDRFGEAIDATYSGVLAIGVPQEDVGKRADAGAVTVLRIVMKANGIPTGKYTGGRVLTQDSTGVQGKAEAWDYLGRSVAVGLTTKGGDTTRLIAAGADNETIGKVKGAGAVTVFGLKGCAGYKACNKTYTKMLGSRSASLWGSFGDSLARGARLTAGPPTDDVLIIGRPSTGDDPGGYYDLNLRTGKITTRLRPTLQGLQLGSTPFVTTNSAQLWRTRTAVRAT